MTVSTDAMRVAAADIQKTLNDALKSLDDSREVLKDSSISNSMTQDEVKALIATQAFINKQLDMHRVIVVSLLRAFNLCIQHYSESRESVLFFNRVRWLFSSKAAIVWIIIVVSGVIKFLYSSGAFPK